MPDSHPDDAVPPPPSAKAQGKRPANGTSTPSLTTADHEHGTPTPSAATPNTPKTGMQTRPKRVLPTRSRRGGPGVGSCEVDIMILETRKRRLENEPLIPADTHFLLTTNSALVPPASDDTPFEAELNTQAYSRYFDRPEVQQAYREQQIIQTPEFSLLPEDAVVGGRFRPRGSDEEIADTSDAAYEKRHRKYETFEKRQRLREKEKLKHEQYKLKERIEQLRAMETSAFLSLPASSFSDPPGVVHGEEQDEADPGISDLPGAHVNGAAAYNEAERRRREMLEVADSLEERYRVLLPPDRKWAEKKEAEKREKEKARRESAGFSAEPEQTRAVDKRVERAHPHLRLPEPPSDEGEEQGELVEEEEETHVPPPPPVRMHKHDSDGESEVDFEQRDRERSKGLKIRLRFPPGLIIRKPAATAPGSIKRKKYRSSTPDSTLMSASASVSPVYGRGRGRGRGRGKGRGKVRGMDGRFMPSTVGKYKRHMVRATSDELSSTGGPPAKKYKVGAAHAHAAATVAKSECLLMKAAERSAAVPSARKTQRHMHAFGVAVPEELAQVRDFEIPMWCWPDSGRTDDEDDEDLYWNGHGFDAHGPGAAPAYGLDEHWADEYEDTKDDFPEIATLDDD